MTDKIVPEFAKAVLNKTGSHIKSIIFFGSRVKNTHKPYSDYNFLIVLDRKESNIVNKIYEEALDFLLDYKVNIPKQIRIANILNSKHEIRSTKQIG